MTAPPAPWVILTREPGDQEELAARLGARGVPVREIPCTSTVFIEATPPPGPIQAVAVGSRRGARGLLRQGWWRDLLSGPPRPIIAATGPATAEALQGGGIDPDLIADPPTGRRLAELLSETLPMGARVATVRGNLASPGLEPGLQEAGLTAVPVVVYENPPPTISDMDPFPVAAVFVASPSAARRILDALPWLQATTFVAIGPTTGQALGRLGVRRVVEAGISADTQEAALHAAWTEQPQER